MGESVLRSFDRGVIKRWRDLVEGVDVVLNTDNRKDQKPYHGIQPLQSSLSPFPTQECPSLSQVTSFSSLQRPSLIVNEKAIYSYKLFIRIYVGIGKV